MAVKSESLLIFAFNMPTPTFYAAALAGLITVCRVDPGVFACELFIFFTPAMTLQKVLGHAACCPG